ncbi:hypothetical protein ACFLUH_01220 [Chloroflexota bacterium]
MSGMPVVLILIVAVLIMVAVLAFMVSKTQKESIFQNLFLKNKVFLAQWLTGLVLALTGAFFMFDGDILGDNTTGIARIMGIVGVSLIATSSIRLINFKSKSTEE